MMLNLNHSDQMRLTPLPGQAGACGSSERALCLPTRLGWLRARFTGTGLSALVFVSDGSSEELERTQASVASREAWLAWVGGFAALEPAAQWQALHPAGTDFQKSVWRALLEIPYGGHLSYGQVAAQLGRPGASRAVGRAVGANPIAVLIPCHRVLPATGQVGHYRWGTERKRALLDAEQESGSHLGSLFT